MKTRVSGVFAILMVCVPIWRVAADEQHPLPPTQPAEALAQELGDARTLHVAGIVLASLGIVSTFGLVVSGSFLGTCIAARNRVSGEGCTPGDLSSLSTLTEFTGGLAVAGLGVGIPLWAVGQSRLSKSKQRARLTIAPHVESGGLAGASANLGFAW